MTQGHDAKTNTDQYSDYPIHLPAIIQATKEYIQRLNDSLTDSLDEPPQNNFFHLSQTISGIMDRWDSENETKTLEEKEKMEDNLSELKKAYGAFFQRQIDMIAEKMSKLSDPEKEHYRLTKQMLTSIYQDAKQKEILIVKQDLPTEDKIQVPNNTPQNTKEPTDRFIQYYKPELDPNHHTTIESLVKSSNEDLNAPHADLTIMIQEAKRLLEESNHSWETSPENLQCFLKIIANLMDLFEERFEKQITPEKEKIRNDILELADIYFQIFQKTISTIRQTLPKILHAEEKKLYLPKIKNLAKVYEAVQDEDILKESDNLALKEAIEKLKNEFFTLASKATPEKRSPEEIMNDTEKAIEEHTKELSELGKLLKNRSKTPDQVNQAYLPFKNRLSEFKTVHETWKNLYHLHHIDHSKQTELSLACSKIEQRYSRYNKKFENIISAFNFHQSQETQREPILPQKTQFLYNLQKEQILIPKKVLTRKTPHSNDDESNSFTRQPPKNNRKRTRTHSDGHDESNFRVPQPPENKRTKNAKH